MKYTLPTLSYSYDALEQFIDTKTMEIHHTKHHQAYINNMNAALEKFPEVSETALESLLADTKQIPAEIATQVINNGGGHYNHSFFWTIMTPNSPKAPLEKMSKEIDTSFGSFDALKTQFQTAGLSRFGSGWVWLVRDTENKLKIYSTPNQDTPLSNNHKPILALDLWEHAYYLKYQNKRNEYIKNWWNVINWEVIETL